MQGVKRVCEYGRLSFWEALALPCDLFQLMLKNSIVDELQKTKEGREYLADCERLEATEPDIAGLSRVFGIRGKGDCRA